MEYNVLINVLMVNLVIISQKHVIIVVIIVLPAQTHQQHAHHAHLYYIYIIENAYLPVHKHTIHHRLRHYYA